ncbi:uncharacterized protein PG998_006852 [Apiospora kogelbergensis]|uniref:uncharacterized protein n=1 Tax=Apiospora kogelbergensis TaxID=1337665 RepID=UPI00312DCB8F
MHIRPTWTMRVFTNVLNSSPAMRPEFALRVSPKPDGRGVLGLRGTGDPIDDCAIPSCSVLLGVYYRPRLAAGREQDARFTVGVRRLNEWMRWMVRNRRYIDEDLRLRRYCPELMPQPHEHDLWDEVAAHVWNEVVEEYPDADQVDAAVLGEENPPPRVGEAFAAWVAGIEGVDAIEAEGPI